MGKRGPKLTEIDWEEFEKLCALHCTLIEIAEWFKCSVDTIERAVLRNYREKFADIYKKKSSNGKISLRRKMYETAMGGNITMMIWLSKQLLGYTDKIDQKSSVNISEVKPEIVILPYNGYSAKE